MEKPKHLTPSLRRILGIIHKMCSDKKRSVSYTEIQEAVGRNVGHEVSTLRKSGYLEQDRRGGPYRCAPGRSPLSSASRTPAPAPAPAPTPTPIHVDVIIDPELSRALFRHAKMTGATPSDLVKEAVTAYLVTARLERALADDKQVGG